MTDSVYVSVNKFVTSLKKVVKKSKAYVVYFDRYYKSDFNRINVPPLFIGYINEKNKLVEIKNIDLKYLSVPNHVLKDFPENVFGKLLIDPIAEKTITGFEFYASKAYLMQNEELHEKLRKLKPQFIETDFAKELLEIDIEI